MNMENGKEEKANLRRYLDDLYTKEEAKNLLNGLRNKENSELFDGLATEVWEESCTQQLGTDLEREKYKKEAHELLKHIEHSKRTWFRRVVSVAASVAAAAFIILGSISHLNYMDKQKVTYAEISTSFGEKKQLLLPDGTTLILNSCSSVRYPSHFVGDTREIALEGEGYFKVAHNAKLPFIVKTENCDVRVLGTRFNVKAYPTDEIVSVSVESGKVQVDLPEAMMRLVAQEQVLINTISGEYSKRKEDREVAGWIKGALRFNSTPIRDVARELERVYNCRITFAVDEEFNNLISGEHDNKSLESVLKSIEYVSGIKYQKQGRNILLYK